jgi:repressor LexA
METLTKRQQQVLRFVAEFIRENGFSPTVREVARAMRIAIKGAQDHLAALERKGHIERKSRKSRTLQVVGIEAGGIPIVGRIAAGRPIEAVENFEGVLAAPPGLFVRGDLFALKVRGDSMLGDHVCDGDLAVIRKQPTVENGEIAAVLLDHEVTLKRVFARRGQVELRSSNAAYKPSVVPAESVRILGKLVGLVRA